jgi:endoglucanase
MGGGPTRPTGSGGTTGNGGTRSPSGGTPGAGGTSGTAGQQAAGGRSGTGGRSSSGGTGGRSSSGGTGDGGNTLGGPDAGTGRDGAGPAGDTRGSGGISGTGGGSTTGQLTPQEAVKLMSPGWNLGNSFDAIPNETSWGNPTPSQNLIKGVHAAGFKLLRLAVGWTDHMGPGPSYTIDSAWMSKVKQTAQWAVDDGMYVFVNTHHDSDGTNGGWVTFPSSTAAAQSVATQVSAVWTQIANAFKSFDSRLMLECFNEPNYQGSNNDQTRTVLNLYLEACYKAIRDTGGANATRIVMIQPIGASPIQAGIQAMQKVSFISDPNLVLSLHTYYPTNFGLSTTPYNWGSAADYTSMQDSIAKQIRVWLPTQVIFVGEWGSMAAQPAAARAAHALAYAQDTTTAGIVPIWWDNGGSGSESFSLFNRNTGAVTQSAIVNGIMTGVKNGLASPNTWATRP